MRIEKIAPIAYVVGMTACCGLFIFCCVLLAISAVRAIFG